jgi:hypothetical protein
MASRWRNIFSRSSNASTLMNTPSPSPLFVMKTGSPVFLASSDMAL